MICSGNFINISKYNVEILVTRITYPISVSSCVYQTFSFVRTLCWFVSVLLIFEFTTTLHAVGCKIQTNMAARHKLPPVYARSTRPVPKCLLLLQRIAGLRCVIWFDKVIKSNEYLFFILKSDSKVPLAAIPRSAMHFGKTQKVGTAQAAQPQCCWNGIANNYIDSLG